MQGKQIQVLLVDDDKPTLKAFSSGLKKVGLEVCSAENAEQAMTYIAQQFFDLAILDVQMQNISGIDLAGWMKENTELPFIFLSAYSDEEIVSAAIDQGALGYLVKPVKLKNLLPTIESAIKRGQDIKALRQVELQLSEALQGNRLISTAIGIIMERYKITQTQAYERLRNYARSHQKKIGEVANQVLEYSDTLNTL